MKWSRRPARRAPTPHRSSTTSSPQRIINSLILASVYLDQRRFAEAETLLTAALRADPEETIGMTADIDLTSAAIRQEDCVQAEKHARLALASARRLLPPSHPTLAIALNNLAQVCRLTGNYLEAERSYRQALEIWESVLGPSHPDVAHGLMNLAALCHERGREPGAEQLYRRAVAIFDQALGPESPDALVARSELADVLRAERRYTEAERTGGATMASLEKSLGPEGPRVWRAMVNYARPLRETRRAQEAEALLTRIHQSVTAFR